MPTLSIRRRAVLALSLACLATSAARAEDAKVMTAADLVAAVRPSNDVPADADLAVESAKLSQALNSKFAGQTITFDVGLIMQIITEGGGVKLVGFPATDPAKGIGRSLSYAVLTPAEEAAGKKLSPGDSASVRGKVVSISAKVDTDTAGKILTHVHVTMEDSVITDTKLKPRKKPATAATKRTAN